MKPPYDRIAEMYFVEEKKADEIAGNYPEESENGSDPDIPGKGNVAENIWKGVGVRCQRREII